MLIGRRQNLLAVFFGTFLVCLSACTAQQQEEASIVGDENGLPKVGEPFRDCPECPEMVVVPAGSFLMGSQETEEGRYENEGPLHRVTFTAPFAVGIYEVTFDEWDACVASGGCVDYRVDDEGWGRGRWPVINLNWHYAQAYVAWLSGKTGKDYRLLSESEWEYAARAGTTTPFHTGATISTDQANYYGDYVYGNGREGTYRRRTLPVGSFAPNDWGLHDVHGNAGEWVQDCWNDNYQGAPADGSAWLSDNCLRHVVRGGSWKAGPAFSRSAYRTWDFDVLRYYSKGFRVARTLTP